MSNVLGPTERIQHMESTKCLRRAMIEQPRNSSADAILVVSMSLVAGWDYRRVNEVLPKYNRCDRSLVASLFEVSSQHPPRRR